jgi:molybdate transport system regulatory protein
MPRARLKIASQLSVETRGGTFASQRWMELLEQLETTCSITAAAKSIGLSYKAAWDAIEAMNNLAEGPLVERTTGGKGGGGTRLTARGTRLVATFRAVQEENARFMERLNRRVGDASPDLRMLGRLTMLTSARNHLSGTVTRIRKGAVNDEVELALSGGDRIVAIVTRESTENLGLEIGGEVIALIKASWVIVGVDDGSKMKLSARNRLDGTVRRLTPGAVNTEVVIECGGGNSIAAVITNVAAKELKLAPGKPACAIFKASSVILGASG